MLNYTPTIHDERLAEVAFCFANRWAIRRWWLRSDWSVMVVSFRAAVKLLSISLVQTQEQSLYLQHLHLWTRCVFTWHKVCSVLTDVVDFFKLWKIVISSSPTLSVSDGFLLVNLGCHQIEPWKCLLVFFFRSCQSLPRFSNFFSRFLE